MIECNYFDDFASWCN